LGAWTQKMETALAHLVIRICVAPPIVGRGCHSLRSLLRNSEASLPLVESRIRERVVI
jgi:hypothetical protein